MRIYRCKSMVLDGFLWFPMFLYGFNDVVDDLHNCFNMFHWLSRLLIGTSLVAPAGQLPDKHRNVVICYAHLHKMLCAKWHWYLSATLAYPPTDLLHGSNMNLYSFSYLWQGFTRLFIMFLILWRKMYSCWYIWQGATYDFIQFWNTFDKHWRTNLYKF